MSEQQPRYVQCPVLVLRVNESQVTGDTVADALRDEFLALYEHSGAVHIVLDMGQVTYLSSAGIRPLLSLTKKAREREGRLILTGLSPEVAGVLVATGLVGTSRQTRAAFETHADGPAAVAALYHEGEGGG